MKIIEDYLCKWPIIGQICSGYKWRKMLKVIHAHFPEVDAGAFIDLKPLIGVFGDKCPLAHGTC